MTGIFGVGMFRRRELHLWFEIKQKSTHRQQVSSNKKPLHLGQFPDANAHVQEQITAEEKSESSLWVFREDSYFSSAVICGCEWYGFQAIFLVWDNVKKSESLCLEQGVIFQEMDQIGYGFSPDWANC